ncbi:GAF and ANTAR domain-containing protein [Streptomyces sp. NPDC045470]|uniref:GAF and ANTAR domain-containing protein n=1 Tax=unclassified Streptomyces TaxID=2593676 RepID=UPI003405320F
MHDDDHSYVWHRITATAGGDVTLAAACQACAADVNADCLGITLVVADDLRMLGHASDERAKLMEDAQLVSGEGPCTDAYVTGTLVEEADLHHAFERWPAFTQTAAEQHMRSVTALPLVIGALRFGAVDFYRTAPGLLSPAEKTRALAYARILSLLTLDEHPHLLTAEFRLPRPGPQGYPASVHVAAGILAEKHRLSTDDALARLRAHAFRHNQPLLQTADHVLANHTLD